MPNPLPSADQLQMLVEEVELSILNYCNIAEVPEALKFVWANMVVDYWRYLCELATSNASSESEIEPGSSSTATMVTSIREGDTQISFAADPKSSSSNTSYAGNAHTMSGVLDSIVLNYNDSLNKFRRIVW